jgi:two-component system sensor histidine kinase KdpD
MADRERIFDRYYRSSNSSSQAAGTGIGLSIAKRAAMAHGGSVWVASDETEGTTFFAAIPVLAPTPMSDTVSSEDSSPDSASCFVSTSRSFAKPLHTSAFKGSSQ